MSFELCSAKEVDHFPNEVEGLAFVWKIERYNNVVASGYLLPSSYCATFSSRFVFVSPNYRRRGLYTSVLKTVAAHADIISCSKVEGRQTADAESVWLSMECERENAVGKDKFILRRSQ
ncbi:GNAT family N-acetyltransferase [Photobacterium leiognathi]|uniref:GNAT family N-acetyltransferase n=1 Tax=Photobacterium leiognathi TaxID=553611 RepID=UPI002980A3E6|nr:GNAT family N-acetyltransferase [Photobacterium leiognathi]